MVVSNAMQKTIKVKVTSQKLHPIVRKVTVKYNFEKKEKLNVYRLSNHIKITLLMMKTKLVSWAILYVLKLADLLAKTSISQ